MGRIRLEKRILIVNQDPNAREALAQTLAASGYQVYTAADEIAALFQFGFRQPDVVILDEREHEALRRIRSLSSVPIIALAAADSTSGSDVLGQGADYYVRQPNVGELQAKIRASFRRQ